MCLHVSIQWIYTCTRCHELFQPVSFAVLRHSQWTCMRGLDIWVYTIIYVHVRMYYDRTIKSTVIAWYCIRTIHTLYIMCFNVYIYIYISLITCLLWLYCSVFETPCNHVFLLLFTCHGQHCILLPNGLRFDACCKVIFGNWDDRLHTYSNALADLLNPSGFGLFGENWLQA